MVTMWKNSGSTLWCLGKLTGTGMGQPVVWQNPQQAPNSEAHSALEQNTSKGLEGGRQSVEEPRVHPLSTLRHQGIYSIEILNLTVSGLRYTSLRHTRTEHQKITRKKLYIANWSSTSFPISGSKHFHLYSPDRRLAEPPDKLSQKDTEVPPMKRALPPHPRSENHQLTNVLLAFATSNQRTPATATHLREAANKRGQSNRKKEFMLKIQEQMKSKKKNPIEAKAQS